MGGAAFRSAATAVFSSSSSSSSSSSMAGRMRRVWTLSPAGLPLALSNSAWPSPFPRSFTLVASPPPLSSPTHLRLRGRAVARALLQDAAATIFSFSGAYSLVRSIDALTERNLIQKSLSRKIVHVLSGLLYMSTWPFFSTSAAARYFAAVVPFLNCIRLLSYGLRIFTDESLVKSISREGKPEELLRGPLYFVIILLLCVLVFWRDSPVGIVSLAMMSGGDGFADIVGRRYGTTKLPYNQEKSWAGSISMFAFGFLISVGMLYYFSAFGYFHFDQPEMVARVALISLAATVVESLPISHVVDDNISVPLTSMLSALLLFGP
ncbi:probable phytol kinase, chloroplastic [Zingiber officinale]|uniref:probable phytol kinase, chloroplastic n=1 Tax=Zingiber officinale TaxID=94328 RepID=UPI001C4B6CDB|nr:probable phytol kinase, chloroplastic [Zingiber officinale]